jgi:hypothetical protein
MDVHLLLLFYVTQIARFAPGIGVWHHVPS